MVEEFEFLKKVGVKGGCFSSLVLTVLSSFVYFLIAYFVDGNNFSNAFIIFLFTFIPNVFIILTGVTIISYIFLSLENKMNSALAGFLGFGIGVILTLTINYVLFLAFYQSHYSSFLNYLYVSFILLTHPFFFSIILPVLLLTYAGWKVNNELTSDDTI